MNINKVWFYNVSKTGQRQRWSIPFMLSFESQNDIRAKIQEMTNSSNSIGSIQSVFPLELSLTNSTSYDRKAIDMSSIMKLVNILKKEKHDPGNALVLDSDILCVAPLSEWQSRIKETDAPLIFLHRESNKRFTRNNKALPPPRETMASGSYYDGVVGNLGAYVLNKKSPHWTKFYEMVLIESANQFGIKGRSDGTVILAVTKSHPEFSTMVEIGTLEKTAKKCFYYKNIDKPTSEKIAFLHIEADRKSPSYLKKIMSRAKKTKRLRMALSRMIMSSPWITIESIKPHFITVCLNCSDFLERALPSWIEQSSGITVVTSPEDSMTISVCESYGVNVVLSDKKGDGFNRGAMLNDGFDSLPPETDWVLHIDSDIVLPPNFFEFIDGLSPENLYSALRIDARSLRELSSMLGSLRKELPRFDQPGSGYFQLFSFRCSYLHGKGRRLYLENHNGCNSTDVAFTKFWPRERKIWLPECVFHMANHDKGINWFGRTSEKFV